MGSDTHAAPSILLVFNAAGFAIAQRERGWNRATALLVVAYPAAMTTLMVFDRRWPPLFMLFLQPFIHLAFPLMVALLVRVLINRGGFGILAFTLANFVAYVHLMTVLVPAHGDPPAG